MKEITDLETFERAFQQAKDVIKRVVDREHAKHWAEKWWNEFGDCDIATGSMEDGIVEAFLENNPKEDETIPHDVCMWLVRNKVLQYNEANALTVEGLCDLITE